MENIERDMPECEKWNMKDEVHEGFEEMRQVGDELADAVDELHAVNERHMKHVWDALHDN